MVEQSSKALEYVPDLLESSSSYEEVASLLEAGIKEVPTTTIHQQRWQLILSITMCGLCLLINSCMSFFFVEKKRIWTYGHVLPVGIEMAELGFLISIFLSLWGSILSIVTEDWSWYIPSASVLAMSSGIFILSNRDCLP